ncbi:MAG: PilZ domain-containing protein [Gammaproteobacteria bacterium]|nr:PilZ domain-containing protein [Gammaproteobacteria bacterium]
MNSAINTPEISSSKNLSRKEDRYNYSMDILVRTKSKRGKGTTINISTTGMKFSTTSPLKVSVKDFVYINMPELNEHLNNLITDDEKKSCILFMYEVVYIEKHLDKINIACKYVGHSASDLSALEIYVKEKLHICEIDSSHDLDNIKNNYYDFLYFDNITSFVYYFSPTEKKCLFIESENNQHLYNYITHPDSQKIDLSAFTSSFHLTHIYKNTKPESDFYIFIFWEDKQLNFYYDFEAKNKNDLITILQQTVRNHGYILKGHTRSVSLIDKDKEKGTKLNFPFSNGKALQQVIFNNVSKCISECFFELMPFSKSEASSPLSIKRDEDEPYQHNLFLYNSHLQRKENRYLYRTGVSMNLNKEQKTMGETIDFSYSGVALLLNGQFNSIKPRSTVWLDYNDLNKTMSKLQLNKVPYKVQSVTSCPLSNNTILGLIRISKDCSTDINQFFEIVIDKNSTKLTICRQDNIDYVEKKLIENNLKDTLDCIPVFLNNKNNQLNIKEIKIYNENCRLVQFFKTGKEYDFSSLMRKKLLESFSQYMHLKSHEVTPFVAFLVKIDNAIKIVTNIEITDSSTLLKIASDTIKRKGLCVLIKFRANDQIDTQAFEMSYKTYRLNNLDEMNLAREKVSDICGYMELNDITSIIGHYL